MDDHINRKFKINEYIPKSLALDIIARLCTDYSAAYAEISALRGITIEEEIDDVSQ